MNTIGRTCKHKPHKTALNNAKAKVSHIVAQIKSWYKSTYIKPQTTHIVDDSVAASTSRELCTQWIVAMYELYRIRRNFRTKCAHNKTHTQNICDADYSQEHCHLGPYACRLTCEQNWDLFNTPLPEQKPPPLASPTDDDIRILLRDISRNRRVGVHHLCTCIYTHCVLCGQLCSHTKCSNCDSIRNHSPMHTFQQYTVSVKIE